MFYSTILQEGLILWQAWSYDRKLNYLQIFDKLAVLGLLELHVQVESTTDPSVSDDRFEDLGAVDLPPLPLALPQHVRGLGEFRGGKRVAGQG